MSLQAEGAVYLTRHPASFSPGSSSGDRPQLVIHAVSRPTGHCAEPIILSWAGERAAQFWAAHRAQLTPGQPLHVVLDGLRTHTAQVGRPATGFLSCTMLARIVDARLLPRATQTSSARAESHTP